MIQHLVIFGASGDLTARYLLPALTLLYEAGKLPREFRIIGVARDGWETETFRRHIDKRLEQFTAGVAPSSRHAILSLLEYRRADITNRDEVTSALGRMTDPLVAYLALPPAIFLPAVEALAAMSVPADSRIVIEKPFGENLASAEALNRLLHTTFPERAIFRMDHFLGEQTVRNILTLRFANRLFEPLWNCQHVARVEVLWDETLALEGRASYYDAAGALRDMIQNHLLQLLCFVGMELPLSLQERDLRDRKVEVLRAVGRLTPEEVERQTVRGRYGAGRVGNRPLRVYVDEEGVDPTRGTETFAQVRLSIDNWRWTGVPFILRSGKALGRDRREIALHFKAVPRLAFGHDVRLHPNVLRLELDPDRVALSVNINRLGHAHELEQVELDTALAGQELPAYGRLFLDILSGDPTFFIRDDEAEASWRIIAGLIRILRGPTPADCMLAAQLFGTTGVAILVLSAPALGHALNDVALVFAVLAAVATVAFVRRSWLDPNQEEGDTSGSE